MDDHSSEFSEAGMSETLGVSRSGYYRWRGRGPSERALENKQFTQQIRRIWEESGKTYGSPRIHAALLADGEILSRPRVARLMRKAGIASQIRPKWVYDYRFGPRPAGGGEPAGSQLSGWAISPGLGQ